MEWEKDMEPFSGTMERCSKDSGKMEQKMGMELGNRPRETFMRANGRWIDSTEKEFSSIDSAHTEVISSIS